MIILFAAHWFIPWLILLAGLAAIFRFARGYMRESVFTRFDGALMDGFCGLLDLQGFVGVIYFLQSGYLAIGVPAFLTLHGIVMFAALVVAHFFVFWKDADDQTRFINNFYVVLVSFILMLVGVSLIPSH